MGTPIYFNSPAFSASVRIPQRTGGNACCSAKDGPLAESSPGKNPLARIRTLSAGRCAGKLSPRCPLSSILCRSQATTCACIVYREGERLLLRKSNPERHEPQADEASGGKEQGVRVGNMIVVAQPNDQRLESFTHRLLAQSYRVRETPHFVVCHEPSANKSLLMHRFSQAEIDADLITLIEQELPIVGLLTSPQEYAAVLFAVLASTFPAPRNQTLIWRHFCLNTLARLRVLIAQAPETFHTAASHVVPFAAIYKRVMELVVGNSLLDVGSSFGFLPVLMAERASNMSLVGCDINPDALRCSTDLAAVSQMNQVTC